MTACSSCGVMDDKHMPTCYFMIREELAAAKAEIKFLENNTKSNVLLMTRNDELESENGRLREALEEYGEHARDCASGIFEAGKAMPDGGYQMKISGKWYRTRPIDERPKCNCGYQSALEVGNYPHTHDCENKWSAGFPCAHGGKEGNA